MEKFLDFGNHLSKETLLILIAVASFIIMFFVSTAYKFFIKHFKRIESNFTYLFADNEATDAAMDDLHPPNGKPGYLVIKNNKRAEILAREDQKKGR